MEEHNKFLRNGSQSLLRMGKQQPQCTFDDSKSRTCNCNGGAYTFAEIKDLELASEDQLFKLRPGL